ARLTTTCCVKQSTRDLSIISTSDNSSLIFQDEIEKSLNENSQIRDLPQLPLSNSSDARTRRPASLQQKTEFGNWMWRRATSDSFSQAQRRSAGDLLEMSVKEVIQPQVPLRLPC